MILIFCFCTNSYALVLQGGKNIPLELNMIVKNLNYYDGDLTTKQMANLKSIDFLSVQLSKDVFFINTKLEIYKSLLKNEAPMSKTKLDGSSLARLKLAISKSKNELMVWFLNALLKDCSTLVNSNEYKEYLLTNTSSSNLNAKKNEHRRIEKKMQILNYWIEKLNPDADDYPENFKKILGIKLIDVISNLNSSLLFIAREMKLKTTLPEDWAFKSFSEVKPTQQSNAQKTILPKPENKSVEDILAPITNEGQNELPEPTQENWLEEGNLPDSLKNLPKPTNDAEWLEDF